MISNAEDMHPPLSPPRTAERLFGLGDMLDTQNISASALAQQIRQSDRSALGLNGGTTIATDDFRSAVENSTTSAFQFARTVLSTISSPAPPSDILTTTLISNNFTDDLSTDSGYPLDRDDDFFEAANSVEVYNQTPNSNIPGKYFLESSRDPEVSNYLNLSQIPESSDENEVSMSASTPTSPDEPMHIDAAEKIYDTAKDVWAWGKSVVIFSPFLGMAEGLAGKVVSVASGETLESVDRAVTDQVQTLDDKVFNPAIAYIVQTILKAAGNTEETLKPIIVKILTPFGLIKTTAETPELTPVPGVTVTQA